MCVLADAERVGGGLGGGSLRGVGGQFLRRLWGRRRISVVVAGAWMARGSWISD
jgi:hypothetical protein